MFEKLMVPIRLTAAILLLIVGPGLVGLQPLQADEYDCEDAPGLICWLSTGFWYDDHECSESAENCVNCQIDPGEECEDGERRLTDSENYIP